MSGLDEHALPPVFLAGSLRYSFVVPMETPSNNKIKNMHWMAYRTLRLTWRIQVLTHALKGCVPEEPLLCAGLVIERHCAGELDWDNAYGGLKPLLDCLVTKTGRNPDGLGLIKDDSPRYMPYPPVVLQKKAKRKESFTNVKIYLLNPP
jgi:hypothetical protein